MAAHKFVVLKTRLGSAVGKPRQLPGFPYTFVLVNSAFVLSDGIFRDTFKPRCLLFLFLPKPLVFLCSHSLFLPPRHVFLCAHSSFLHLFRLP